MSASYRPILGESVDRGVLPDTELAGRALRADVVLSPADSGMRAVPPSIHFSAWAAGASETGDSTHASVRVVNFSGAPRRIFVDRAVVEDAAHPGDAAAFWIDVSSSGPVASGLSQDFHVTFTPVAGRKYYFAAVKITSDAGTEMRIPLHAYPIASGFIFPSRVDFGRVPLGEIAEKTIHLKTKVPLCFSVVIAPRVINSDMTIFPAAIIIPPGAEVPVTFTYAPSSHGTAIAEYNITTSTNASGLGRDDASEEADAAWGIPLTKGGAFGRAPSLVCTLRGSSGPGMHRDAMVLLAMEGGEGGGGGERVRVHTAQCGRLPQCHLCSKWDT